MGLSSSSGSRSDLNVFRVKVSGPSDSRLKASAGAGLLRDSFELLHVTHTGRACASRAMRRTAPARRVRPPHGAGSQSLEDQERFVFERSSSKRSRFMT